MSKQLKLIFVDTVSTLLIILFTYTSFDKLNNLAAFSAVLKKSPLLGEYSSIISRLIPSLEIAIVGFLFFPGVRTRGLFLSFCLMMLFTGYIAYMILFTPDLPCSCGGVLKSMSWTEHLFFNSSVALLSGVGWYWAKMNQRFIAINRGSRTPV